MSAVIQNEYTGNNSTTTYSFTFPYLKTSDIKASLDGVATTAFTLPNATTLQFNTAPGSGVKIKIFRETSVDDLTATFYAGSAIKSEDLNDNFTQNLYKTQEVGARALNTLGGTMTGNLTLDTQADIVFEGATADAHETTIKVADPTADRTITFPNVTGTVVTTGDTGTVATAMIADDAITQPKLASNAVTTDNIANNAVTTITIIDDAVTTAKIADNNVTSAKLASNSVTNAKVATNAISSATIIDGNVTTAKIADSAVTTAKIANASITAAKIAAGSIVDDDINASAAIAGTKLADGGISTAKIANDAVTSAKIANNAVSTSEIAANSVTTSILQDSSVTTDKIADSAVSTAKIANNAVTTAKIAPSAVTTSTINNDAITSAKIATDAVGSTEIGDGVIDTVHVGAAQITTAKIADANITADKIADTAILTGKLADNAVTIGKLGCEQTTISDSDSHIPTSGAVVDYVTAQIDEIGGFEAIANELSFPNTQPGAGVAISIADAAGIVVTGSNSSTTGRTVGGTTVTINNISSQFTSSTIPSGVRFIVTSTGSGHVYNYHKATLPESDLANLSGDINDFNERYRVGSSNPTSSLDSGDLFFNTSTGKLLVYNGTNSAWEEAQSIGNFFISTLSPAFDGSTQNFTITNAPTNSQQILLSINGVVQKPNAGTSTPSEGFALSGSTVKLSAAPAAGDSYHAVVLGSTVNIGTPSNNTVSTAILQDDSVTAAKIAAGAVGSTELAADGVITSKIADDAVTHDKLANHSVDVDKFTHGTSSNNGKYLRATNGNHPTWETVNTDLVSDTTPQLGGHLESNGSKIKMADSDIIELGNDGDLKIYHDGSHSYINENGSGKLRLLTNAFRLLEPDNSTTMISADENAAVELYYNGTKRFETQTNGAQVNGQFTVDGNLIAYSASNNSLGLAGHRWNDLFIANDIDILDNGKLLFGNSDDLQIYHNGSHSYITDVGTGNLNIEGNGSSIRINNGSSENMGVFYNNAQVELFHDGTKTFETSTTGIEVIGANTSAESRVRVVGNEGQNAEILLSADEGDDTADHWRIRSRASDNGLDLVSYASGSYVSVLKGTSNRALELHFQGNKVAETSAVGIELKGSNTGSESRLRITGNEGCNSEILFSADEGDDSADHWRLRNIASNNRFDLVSYATGSYVPVWTAQGGSSAFLGVQSKFYIGTNYDDNYSSSTGVRFMSFGGGSTWMTNTINQSSGGNTPGPYIYNINSSHNGTRFYVKVDGGVVNHSGNNSNLCDERMKTNIVDAPSYYDTIKNIGIKKFNYKSEPEGSPLKVGVIAQQVETVEANLVDDEFAVDGNPNEESTTKMKAVHEEQLFMMGIKALQESMAKIEALETKVAALEAA